MVLHNKKKEELLAIVTFTHHRHYLLDSELQPVIHSKEEQPTFCGTGGAGFKYKMWSKTLTALNAHAFYCM